jgi:PAS domain S-box-containing protein
VKLIEGLLDKIYTSPVENRIAAIRKILFETVLFFLCGLGFIAVLMGGVEVYLQGRWEIVFFYIGAYLPALICFFLRNKISYNTLTNIVLLDLYILSVLILGGVGLSGGGIPLLITFCILTTTFQGIGRGLISILMSVGAILSVGLAMSTGLIPIDLTAMTNSTRMEAWGMASVVVLLIGSTMVVCLGILQEALHKTIKGLQENARALQASNEQLETAMKRQRKAEDKFRTMIEYSNDMIWTLDRAGNFTFLDKQAQKITGLNANDWLGKSFVPLLLEEDLPLIEDIFQRGLEGESSTYELKFKKEDDNLLTISVTTAPIFKEGEITGLVSFGRDITEEKKLKARLLLSQKMESIGTLAGGIAHDFNNILFPIIGHTEMLMEDVGKQSPFHSSLNKIHSGAMRAKGLVNQILTFSRQDENELKLMKIQPIIKEVMLLIRSTIPAMIKINQDISPDCGVIRADSTQLHQIIMNLATNAYYSMKETGGELTITLKEIELGKYDLLTTNMKPGPHACLCVTDTGMGMDKNLTEKIFEPFFTTKEKGKGTGMGLSVVHGIVTGMGGAVQVYSEPGKGTRFNVYFPLDKSAGTQDNYQKQDPVKKGHEKILLVDDEDAILVMEKQMLERLGYQVTPFISSRKALDAFDKNPDEFDLVITDMAMPDLPGDKLAVALKRIRQDIPVLICTGFSENMTEEKAASLGISGVLMKPLLMKEFSQKIRAVLSSS